MDTESAMLLLALGLPFLGSPLLAVAGRRLGWRVGWLALALALVTTGALAGLAWNLGLPARRIIEWSWVPSMGLNLSFLVDGLSVFFGLVVSGMGCLVIFHAIFYLGSDVRHAGRFYSYLALFMAAMLGTVFSNHLVLLFIFWELTGVASFLLIGFLHGKEDSRVGARQALLVTGVTGLALFAGVMLVQHATGISRLDELMSGALPWAEKGTLLTAGMVLMLVGALGKSAQIPFHFWLPNAMAAPTPVSAYLHSATMVKLGVFLVARVYPIFVGNELWAPMLGVIGFATMALAAVMALVSHDLKAILAYSTISQLGYLIGQYGLGPAGGVSHDYLHLFNHVCYKGCLFMMVGVVIHASGVRDLRELGGLFGRMPLLGVTAMIASASMAGLPGTLGFLSKEMMLGGFVEGMRGGAWIWKYAAVCVGLASVVKVAFSIRLFSHIFLGPTPETVRMNYHPPGLWMQLPAVLLAGCVLVFGVVPGWLDGPFAALRVEGLNRTEPLTLWHGFTIELLISAVLVGLGAGLFGIGQWMGWNGLKIPVWLRLDRGFEAGIEGFSGLTRWTTRVLRSDRPMDYLPILITFVVGVMGWGLLWNVSDLPGRLVPEVVTLNPLRMLVAGLIALTVVGVLVLRRWTAQLISLAVAGFLTCFYFVLYRAPDLALTQILVETVTLILVLLLLARFPVSAQVGEEVNPASRGSRLFRGALSIGVGCLATVLVLLVTADPHPEPIGRDFLERTVDLAKGSNAVNTILVDFRGFDTLGEISVLVIAVLGCLGLLMRYKRTPEEYRQGPMGPPGFGVEEKPRD